MATAVCATCGAERDVDTMVRPLSLSWERLTDRWVCATVDDCVAYSLQEIGARHDDAS